MAEPLFGFLTSLVDIHFPGQTGPAAGDKYNIDITFFIRIIEYTRVFWYVHILMSQSLYNRFRGRSDNFMA